VESGSVIAADRDILGLSAMVFVEGSLAPPAGLSVKRGLLENRFVRIRLSPDGTLESVFDKRADRECLAGRGNQMRAYVDKPRLFDAWDIEEDYAAQSEEISAVGPAQIVERGQHRGALRFVRTYRGSTIVQTVRLWANSPRIEFKTDIDWHERRILLKAEFPLAIRAETAIFECAHGIVRRPTHRNTSWDQAKFEVAAHRFVDLSEHGFGVALLNDGKYGHHALGNEIGISLLRSPVNPDTLADEGAQSFTYALLPHPGDWLSGGVLSEAEDLNQPLLCRTVETAHESAWRAVGIDGMTLGLSGFKPAEEGSALILRTYEPAGARGAARVSLSNRWRIAGEVDILEETVGAASTSFAPFQVRSWRLQKTR
jgi:alpha-mannosidase